MQRYWIWLAELKSVSLLQKHRLLEQFGDPETLHHTSETALEQAGVSPSVRKALQDKDLQKAKAILRDCGQKKIGILPVTDAAYPRRLANTPDAPILLYYKGILPKWESVPFIGVVGTRQASVYGLQVARHLSGQIASCGGIIVSGGAAGADTAAMQGALDAGCPVVGVLGGGVDVVYPRSNQALFEKVLEKGCLLSEYPPGDKPEPWHFPVRNRIISGISNGVLVAEAPKKSGALITAQSALEQGRDVFVVPGNIDNPACEGSNRLLQEGATPVFSGWDVVSGYEFLYPGKLKKQKTVSLYTEESHGAKVAQNPASPKEKEEKPETARKNIIDNGPISSYSVLENAHPALSDEEKTLLAELTSEPKEPAEVIDKLSWSAGKVLSLLTMLTVKGLVCKHPGGRFSLK